MSEISQLHEMHAVLLASKDEIACREQEATQLADKIRDLEKQLEQEVTLSNSHRASKVQATKCLQSLVDRADDLLVKIQLVQTTTSSQRQTALQEVQQNIQDYLSFSADICEALQQAHDRINEIRQAHFDCAKDHDAAQALTAALQAQYTQLQTQISEAQAVIQEHMHSIQELTKSNTQRKVEVENAQAGVSALQKRVQLLQSQLQQLQDEKQALDQRAAELQQEGDIQLEQLAKELEQKQANLEASSVALAQQAGPDTDRVQQELDALQQMKTQLEERSAALADHKAEATKSISVEEQQCAVLQQQIQTDSMQTAVKNAELTQLQLQVKGHCRNQPSFEERQKKHGEMMAKIEACRADQAKLEQRRADVDQEREHMTRDLSAAIEAAQAKSVQLEAAVSALAKEKEALLAEGARISQNIAEAQTAAECTEARRQEVQAETRAVMDKVAALEGQAAQDDKDRGAQREAYGLAKAELQAQLQAAQEEEQHIRQEDQRVKGEVAIAKKKLAAAVKSKQKKLVAEEVQARMAAYKQGLEDQHARDVKSLQEQIAEADRDMRQASEEQEQSLNGKEQGLKEFLHRVQGEALTLKENSEALQREIAVIEATQ